MSEYTKMVENMECDLFHLLPPKQILEHCMSMTLIDMKADGCDGDALEAQLGAVWMASHARIFQYAPIGSGDYLTYRTFPRVIEGTSDSMPSRESSLRMATPSAYQAGLTKALNGRIS